MKIIGVCGPSCSGKSTVANYLVNKLNANIISTDQFYIEDAPKIYVNYNGEKLRTFERKELYDGDRLSLVIDNLVEKKEVKFKSMKMNFEGFEDVTLKKKDYLILEGFLLYTYEKLFDKIDYKFYINISDEEIMKRRKLRSDRPKSDVTFEKIGLDEFRREGGFQKKLNDVYVIDGMKSVEEIQKEILNEIK